MSGDAGAISSPMGVPDPRMAGSPALKDKKEADRGSRSFAQQVLIDTFQRWGARLGLTWILIMVLAAVFSPVLANSYPLLAKTDEGWSSPILRTFSITDAVLLILTFVAVILAIIRRFSFRASMLILLGTLAVSIPVCSLVMNPLKNPVWEEYRIMQQQGKLKTVWWTLVPFSPADRNNEQRDLEHPSRPTRRNWLGIERNGADMFSQMLHASRIALSIGFISTGIAVVIGCLIGGMMGYASGTVDLLGMRLIEIFEAVPRLMLLLAVAALIGPKLYLLMVVIGLTTWTEDARFIRAEFLRLRKQDFVQAAIAGGLPLRSILFRHMLPNGITPVLVTASFGVASAILMESTLSFLGLGDPDMPSWGQLLNQARAGGAGFHWWIAVFPGLAIFLTVFSYNMIGEAMRDALDPRIRKRD